MQYARLHCQFPKHQTVNSHASNTHNFTADISISIQMNPLVWTQSSIEKIWMSYFAWHTHTFHPTFQSVPHRVVLTTGLSMMPLRKMRSRSLAVVELVLSLSVSRAWCMATHGERTEFISLHVLQFPHGKLNRSPQRKKEGEGGYYCSFHYMAEGKGGAGGEEGEGMGAALHLFPSNLTSVSHPPLWSDRIPQLPTSSLSPSNAHVHARTHIPSEQQQNPWSFWENKHFCHFWVNQFGYREHVIICHNEYVLGKHDCVQWLPWCAAWSCATDNTKTNYIVESNTYKTLI